MSDPIRTTLDAARAEAAMLARGAAQTTRGWLRRNVWALLGIAATALVAAGLALLLR